MQRPGVLLNRTPIDRLTEAVARISGSTTFITVHAIWFATWIGFHMLHGLCTKAGVAVAIRDERVQQLFTETDIGKIAKALDQEMIEPE